MTSAPEFARILRELYPDDLPPGMRVTLWDPDAGSAQFASIDDAATALASGRYRYFTPALMHPVLAGRGRVEDVVAIGGLFFDLDTLKGRHAKHALPSHEEGLRFARDLPVEPSLLLDSGGGAYVIWLFREPWILNSDADRDRAQALARGWQHYLIARGRLHGWEFDNTSALNHVFRPEGALNGKYDPSRLVHRVHDSGKRYNPSDFEEWAASVRSEATANRTESGAELPRDLPPAIHAAIEALGASATARRDAESRIEAVVLDVCPACRGVQATQAGIARGTAHVAPLSGALRCKRASCEAHESGGGLLFQDWVERFLSPADADHVHSLRWRELHDLGIDRELRLLPKGAPVVELAEADAGRVAALIADAVQRARATRSIVLVVLPPGAGKTKALIDLCGMRQDVAYFARNHRLLDEVQRTLRARRVRCVRVEGVGRACKFPDAFRHYGRRSDWRGTACQGCQHRTDRSCAAWKWIGRHRNRVVLGVHDSLPSLAEHRDRGDRRLLEDRVVVIDEARQWVETVCVDRRQLRAPIDHPEAMGRFWRPALAASSAIDVVLAESQMRFADRVREQGYAVRLSGADLREQLAAAPGGNDLAAYARAIAVATEWPAPSGEDLRAQRLDPDEQVHPDLRAIMGGVAELLETPAAGDQAERSALGLDVVVGEAGAHVEYRQLRPLPMSMLGGVVLLDATGCLSEPELRAANPGVDVVTLGLDIPPDPAARVRRVHIATQNATRRATLVESVPRPRARKLLRNCLRVVADLAVEHVGRTSYSLGLLTHKPIADQLLSEPDLLAWLTPRGAVFPPERVGYYGRDERGSNHFEGVDVLVTFGDPFANVGASAADAQVLALDADALVTSRTQETLLQAHGRARALRAKGPVLLVHIGMQRPADAGVWELVQLPRGRPRAHGSELVAVAVAELLDGGCVVTASLVEALLLGCAPYTSLPATITFLREVVGDFGGECAVRSIERCVPDAARRYGAIECDVRIRGRTVRAARPAGVDRATAELLAVEADALLRDSPSALDEEEPLHAPSAPQGDAGLDRWAEAVVEQAAILEYDARLPRPVASLRAHVRATAAFLRERVAGVAPRG